MMSATAQKKTIPDRPRLYLVYLVFLFLPWLFVTPRPLDIAVAFAATVVYVPLHFLSFSAEGNRKLVFIAAIAAIGVAMAPFINGYSVFHIYAAAATGYVRPVRTCAITLGLTMVVYITSGLFFDRYILEIIVGLVISIVVWVSTFSDADAHAAHAQAERERTLEAQQASMIERERIARDLHDLLGHTLTLVSLKADLAGRLIETDPSRAKAEIESIQVSSRQALADVRATLSGLTSTSVRQELENGEAALSAAGIRLVTTGSYPDLPPDRDTAAGLMIREAVTNVVRHSSASSVTIMFKKDADTFAIMISDDGGSEGIIEGNGLSGLRKRLEGLGGQLMVSETDGVQIQAVLPA